jgi:hypothetical protein
VSTEMTSQPSSARYLTVERPSLPLPPVTMTLRLFSPLFASPRASLSVNEAGADMMDLEMIVILERANDGSVAQHISLAKKIIPGKKTVAYVMDACCHLQPLCKLGRWTRYSWQRTNHVVQVAFFLWRAPSPPACMTRISTKLDIIRRSLGSSSMTGRLSLLDLPNMSLMFFSKKIARHTDCECHEHSYRLCAHLRRELMLFWRTTHAGGRIKGTNSAQTILYAVVITLYISGSGYRSRHLHSMNTCIAVGN